MDLKGKVAVITGASSGLGKAVAENLSEVGVKLVVTARREDKLNELAANLAASPLPRARPAMKLARTMLEAQTLLPSVSPACRNHRVFNTARRQACVRDS